jgi:hypothetical protein
MNGDRDAWTQWAERHSELAPAVPTRQKYGATAVYVDGLRLDSKREAARYTELKQLEAAGEITALEVHPAYALMVPELAQDGPPTVFHTIGQYHADFKYRNVRTGNTIVEDVKSKPTKTEAYRLRKKFIEAQYQITIVEIA